METNLKTHSKQGQYISHLILETNQEDADLYLTRFEAVMGLYSFVLDLIFRYNRISIIWPSIIQTCWTQCATKQKRTVAHILRTLMYY